ncbi:unnamed protein product, partial [Prorocentrum cordatum]
QGQYNACAPCNHWEYVNRGNERARSAVEPMLIEVLLVEVDAVSLLPPLLPRMLSNCVPPRLLLWRRLLIFKVRVAVEQERAKTQKIRDQLEKAREALRATGEAQCGARQAQRDADQAMQSFDPEAWKEAKAAEAREAEAERLRQQRTAPPVAAGAARAAAEPAGFPRVAGDADQAPAVVESPDFAAKSADELAAWARDHHVPAGLWEAFVAPRATIQSA